jgi:hypothetical protein
VSVGLVGGLVALRFAVSHWQAAIRLEARLAVGVDVRESSACVFVCICVHVLCAERIFVCVEEIER